jgi:hypothetical protein
VWTDCDSEWHNWYKWWGLYGKELLGFRVALVWTDCDSEWLICIKGGFCVEKEL